MTAEISIDVEIGPVRAIAVPVTAVDVTVLQADAYLSGYSLREASGEIPGYGEGSVTSPAALATIATTPVLPAGTYQLNWLVSLGGTVGAGDANNMRITGPSGGPFVALFPGAAGQYPQQPLEVTLTAPTAIIVQAIAVGTVASVYGAEITATPVTTDDAIVEIQDGSNPLAEISLGAGVSDTRFYSGGGLRISQQIKLHIVQGAVTGVIYARFYK